MAARAKENRHVPCHCQVVKVRLTTAKSGAGTGHGEAPPPRAGSSACYAPPTSKVSTPSITSPRSPPRPTPQPSPHSGADPRSANSAIQPNRLSAPRYPSTGRDCVPRRAHNDVNRSAGFVGLSNTEIASGLLSAMSSWRLGECPWPYTQLASRLVADRPIERRTRAVQRGATE